MQVGSFNTLLCPNNNDTNLKIEQAYLLKKDIGHKGSSQVPFSRPYDVMGIRAFGSCWPQPQPRSVIVRL